MAAVDSKKFGFLVRERLMRLGVSQKTLASELEKSYSSVSDFLSGNDGKTVSNQRLEAYINAVNNIAALKKSTHKISDADIASCSVVTTDLDTETAQNDTDFSAEMRTGIYHYSGGNVKALRLWGSSHSSISESDLRLSYEQKNISPAVHYQQGYENFIEERTRQLRAKNTEFFNGPCVRLTRFRVSAEDGANSASEKPFLALHFGPVGWYEYSFLRRKYEEAGELESFNSPSAEMIGLENLLISGDVSFSKTSNILDTATTLITNDGFAGYQRRSGRVSASDKFYTSAVAENMNRWKDECLQNDHKQLFDLTRHYSNGAQSADHSYCPDGPPNPFWTVRRGIDAELADNLSSKVNSYALRLTGISFDLVAGHPDLLFVAFVDMSRAELEKYYLENRGVEAEEGRLQFVHAEVSNLETQALLSSENWTAGGKASFVRALEYLKAVRLCVGGNFSPAFNLVRSNKI